MSEAVQERYNPPRQERRRAGAPLPKEGENGVFSQSWFPIALSSEVPAGTVIGREFLDGKVVIYRGATGTVQVLSAYCPHIGADLSVGTVVGDNVQCAFHHWQFNADGVCAKTGLGDAPPRNACLYNFPTVERYGIIWVFNGHEPLYELLDFKKPDDELLISAEFTEEFTCDPWIFASNTPDLQHIRVVHGVKFSIADVVEKLNWNEYGFRLQLDAEHQNGIPISWDLGIQGTSIYMQEGMVGDFWLGVFSGFSLPRPGRHRVFMAIAVERGDGSEAAEQLAAERMKFSRDLLNRTAFEDRDILNTIHHHPGALTRNDRALGRYFNFLRDYPRAHPSADFIR
jgi:nitrite reductase/ring-hydroxylating ferredoxin subunit